MSLKETIDQELKDALKTKDEIRLSTLRMLKSELKYREIEARHPLTDEEIVRAIRSMMKKREESIASFQEGGREDLIARERAELEILRRFVPAEMSPEELEAVVERVLSRFPERNPKLFGAVMREVMGEVKERADGRKVQEIVRKKLAGS